jgi:hypothetical protein
MFRRPALAVLCVALILALPLAAGCGDDDNDTQSSTATATSVPSTPSSPPTPAVDIRELDLEQHEAVQALLDETGGVYVQSDVLYADVTGDGFDEATVPASSEGTLGYLGIVVLTPAGEEARELVTVLPETTGGFAFDEVEGDLVVTRPVPGPDDPECCPSMLEQTTYAWNGAALAIESVEVVDNPDAGEKATPQPD